MKTETLWIIVTGSILATFIWRFLGALVVRKISSQGDFLEWVTCVSYAMVAGLVFRMIIMPESELASVSLWARLIALAAAFIAYFLLRRSLVAGVLTGGVSLAAMAALGV